MDTNEKNISQMIRDRIRQRLNENITTGDFYDKKTDTILNTLIDKILDEAIRFPDIDKLIKIVRLAEGIEEWKKN